MLDVTFKHISKKNSLSLVETGRILLVLELRFLIAIVSFHGRKKTKYKMEENGEVFRFYYL